MTRLPFIRKSSPSVRREVTMMTRHLLARAGRLAAYTAGGVVFLTALACKDMLKVEDPQTFSNDDLDSPAILQAVADGVEGAFQQVFDDVLVYTELLSDEIEETSTWLPWSDMSNGRVRGDWPTGGDFSGAQNGLLRARYAARARGSRCRGGAGRQGRPHRTR